MTRSGIRGSGLRRRLDRERAPQTDSGGQQPDSDVNSYPGTIRPDLAVARHDILGLQLDYLTPDELVRLVLEHGERGYCCLPNAHQCIEAYRDSRFRQAVNAATYRVSDSKILDLARRFIYGVPTLPTLRGADLLLVLCRAAAREGKRIGLYGGSEDTLARLAGRLQREIPGCEIGYSFSPPFGDHSATNADFADAINGAGVDILFVGLGCPKQEWWMHCNRYRVRPFMIGVGAAFDFVARTKKASPGWIHRFGLEWLYRLVQEPRRLWRRYLVYGPLFIWLVLRQRTGAALD